MRFAKLALVLLACGCSSATTPPLDTVDFAQPDVGTGVVDFAQAAMDLAHTDLFHFDAGATPSYGNTAPLVIDHGVVLGSIDVAYVSVVICAPGSTSNCQTIDHVAVDTASVGMRIVSSVLSASVLGALTHQKTTSGDALAECYTYADGFAYGSVVQADVGIGEEHAASMAFQLVGDLTTVPADCSAAGTNEDTVQTFGYNGVIGVAPFGPDCGANCNSAATSKNPVYYDCPTSGACTTTGVATAMQVQNPVTQLPFDNNGVIIDLPAIDDASGTGGTTGTLYFGIGTRTNNGVGTASIYHTTNSGGLATVSAAVNTTTFQYTILDTGTTIFAASLGLPTCLLLPSYVCPSSTTMYSATLTDAKSVTGSVSFKIANGQSIITSHLTSAAFDDVAGPGVDNLFIMGLPFFFGRRVSFAIDGAPTPNGPGPYYAL